MKIPTIVLDRPDRSASTAAAALLLALCVLWVAPAWPAPAGPSEDATEAIIGNQHCARTTMAAYSACYHESEDDYWIGWADCYNQGEEADRSECFDENRAARREANEECLEQADARDDVCDLIGQERYDPEYEPEDFVDPSAIGDSVQPNPFFPLVPGNRWVYEAEDEIIVVEVLDDIRMIDGIPCAVVRDTVSEIAGDEDGESLESEHEDEPEAELVEDTLDWYAQDTDGNVWYFGEISLNFEDGEIADLEGSWETGEDGARAGILVHAMPVPGSVYRQEFLLAEAEDVAQVVSLDAEPELGEDNPGDCSSGCLQTREWTPIEPDSTEFKYYQPGIGLVQEADPESGDTVELKEFSLAMP